MTEDRSRLGAQRFRWALFLVCAVALAGCESAPWLGDNRDLARRLAISGDLEERRFDAGPFVLLGYQRRASTPGRPLVVYIEGDGHAWSSRYHISPDPTPWNPVSLRLALADPAPNLLYLARPCQYTVGADRRGCDRIYWTSHRFAPEVIAATDRAVDQVVRETGASGVALVGYSGGGALAALVAAGRDDVLGLTTLAANLDHVRWTSHHAITPLTGSRNPADLAMALQAIPQQHFIGGKDRVVPALVVDSYLARMSDRSLARTVVVPDYDHDCCWADGWPRLARGGALAGIR